MSPAEHYFENLLIIGHDIKGEPNKKALSKEIQETIEMCANYIRFDKLYGNTVIEDIKAEIRQLDDLNPDYPMDRTIHISRNAVLEIIDKHISGK